MVEKNMKNKILDEIKNMTYSELNIKLHGLKNEIFKLRFRNRISPIKNPLSIRKLRRDIARISTKMSLNRKKHAE
ncbi:MAG: 50S ribosomal protein L29 [Endomicrobium sp.]|nr:50S ribosomal protein L29 [Endomicrobium sp.]